MEEKNMNMADEHSAQLRQRFACELRWFTDMLDTFRSV